MTSIDDLKKLTTPAPAGFSPGIEWDGNTGHVTLQTSGEQPDPEKVNGVLDSSPFLSSDEVQVDWTARPRVSIHHDDNGNLVQAWYKLPLVKRIDRSFDVQELVNSIRADDFRQRFVGHPWRTLLITDTHIGKSEGAGGGSQVLADRWLESVDNALDGAYEGVNLAFGGDLVEGYASQGGANITETDMTLTEQMRVAQHLVLKTIQKALEVADEVVVSVVPGNHGDTTRQVARPMSDNWDIQIVSNVQQALDLAGETRVTFYYPEHNRGEVVYEAGGDVFCLVHGHKFHGKRQGVEKWWSGQVMNGRPAGAANVLLAGHFHSAEFVNLTEERWAIFGSALENESTWIANINGSSSQSGIVAFDMEDGRPMGMGVY